MVPPARLPACPPSPVTSSTRSKRWTQRARPPGPNARLPWRIPDGGGLIPRAAPLAGVDARPTFVVYWPPMRTRIAALAALASWAAFMAVSQETRSATRLTNDHYFDFERVS